MQLVMVNLWVLLGLNSSKLTSDLFSCSIKCKRLRCSPVVSQLPLPMTLVAPAQPPHGPDLRRDNTV